MKTIHRSSLAALMLGLLSFGANATFAQGNQHQKPNSCCSESCCCGAGSCSRHAKQSESADSMRNQAYKAKSGRDLPGVAPAVTRSSGCCNSCC